MFVRSLAASSRSVQAATQADAVDATCDLVAGGSGADGGDGRPGLARGTTARGAGGGPNARGVGAGGGAGGAITGGGRAVRSGAGAARTCGARTSPALPVVERLEPSSVELSVTVGVEISASPPRIWASSASSTWIGGASIDCLVTLVSRGSVQLAFVRH